MNSVSQRRASLTYPPSRTFVPDRGVLLGILRGLCRPVLEILTLLQTKKCHFPHPFSDLASKTHTRFHMFT